MITIDAHNIRGYLLNIRQEYLVATRKKRKKKNERKGEEERKKKE